MTTTYRDLLETTRAQIKNIDLSKAEQLRREGAVLIDIREQDEIEQGMIDGAVHIPRGYLESRIEQVATDKSAPVIVYCAGGQRSALAADVLQSMGFPSVAHLESGFTGWTQAGRPVEHEKEAKG